MNFLQIAKLILSLFPLLLQAIDTLEEAMPQAGQGQAKLAVIKAALESASQVATEGAGLFNTIWPSVQSVVSALVNLRNGSKGT